MIGVHTPVERLPVLLAIALWAAWGMSSFYPVSRTGRCRYRQCEKTANFNVEGGNKKELYCKQHAEDGKVDVRSIRCSHEFCTKHPSYNVKGSWKAVYCQQHAAEGMVNVVTKRCSHEACTKLPSFNFED
ncbi:unnamed protein product, partial [Laminaria digitata]